MGIEEIVYITTTLLAIVGALNWGAYALKNNLVEKIGNKNIQNAIYYLIAGAGIVSLVFFIRNKSWKEDYRQPAIRSQGALRSMTSADNSKIQSTPHARGNASHTHQPPPTTRPPPPTTRPPPPTTRPPAPTTSAPTTAAPTTRPPLASGVPQSRTMTRSPTAAAVVRPTPPTITSVTPGDKRITVFFDAPVNNASYGSPKGYYYSLAKKEKINETTNNWVWHPSYALPPFTSSPMVIDTYQKEKLEANTEYAVRICAVYQVQGPPSNIVYTKTLA